MKQGSTKGALFPITEDTIESILERRLLPGWSGGGTWKAPEDGPPCSGSRLQLCCPRCFSRGCNNCNGYTLRFGAPAAKDHSVLL
jgi:hypothetical protein